MLIILTKIYLNNMNADKRNFTNNVRIHPIQQNLKDFCFYLFIINLVQGWCTLELNI